MTELIVFFFLFWTAEAFIKLPKSYEASFESWKSNGSSPIFRVRILGREHRVNGSIIFGKDMGNDFSVVLLTYTDPNGSGDFKETPLGAPTTPLCKFIELYWKYLEPSVVYGKNTNFPFVNHPCPLPKGEYYIKDVTIKPEGWPLILPSGFFKAVVIISKDNQIVGTQELVIRIKDRIF